MRHSFRSFLTSLAIFIFTAGPAMAVPVSVEIFTDNYPSETTFELYLDPGGSPTLIDSQGPFSLPQTSYIFDYDLGLGDYRFTIYDVWGDGICCGHGMGQYTLTVDAVEVATGGEFGTSESVEFTVEGPGPAEAIPEPTAVALFAMGSLVVGLTTRQRRS